MIRTDFLDLPPLAAVQGRVRLPGSKSISNRVLLLAALCAGRTTVHDLLDADDTRVMLDALRALGCGVRVDAGASAVIDGLGARARAVRADLFLGNAGTAMRPLTAALAVLGGDYRLHGVPRMHERPIGDLVDALCALGCRVDYESAPGYPPLRIGAHGALRLDAPIPVRGDVSSQFLTALLMALPLASAASGPDIVIEVAGELISKPYVAITLELLARFGVAVRREGWRRFVIPAGSRYQSPGEIHVEADASSASYFIAAGMLSDPTVNSEGLLIEGIGEHAIQGDVRFIDAARQMGGQIESGPNWLRVRRGPPGQGWPLKAIDLDCNAIPDAAMTLAMLALYADGPSTLRNIGSWRVKETDRLAAMAIELRKLGATVQEGADSLHIAPPVVWQPAAIRTYDDHRMAMCASLAAFNPARLPVRVLDPGCVAKTFPDYFETLFAAALPANDDDRQSGIPVICIDGPSASGKGTLAGELARRLGYHYLDSGALYRLTALAARRAGLALDDSLASRADEVARIVRLARDLQPRFEHGDAGERVLLAGEDVTAAIRHPQSGTDASRISALPDVRVALLDLQRQFARLPGLVADGRDMGTVIFPGARLKVFLTASAATRAARRQKQLAQQDISVTLNTLLAELQGRDERDRTRAAAPLKPALDALPLDNSDLTIVQSVDRVLTWWQARQPFSQS
ncbi:MAG: bifunctional 3-phosphoshikimate 1-carboxyvinyltransferase/cytidylate kinase [Burkholderiaceae bacterium]|nr:bifunctional 3-phosphoshikimate 1-carboxyvinyltransferase/cytidylate kinase [Burkholderiaceae bacterium]